MRLIRGHRSFNRAEIVDILRRSGTYTCPTLPHYRYDSVIATCKQLKCLGLLAETGRTCVSVNYGVTDLFREWVAAGADIGVVRWAKLRSAESRKE